MSEKKKLAFLFGFSQNLSFTFDQTKVSPRAVLGALERLDVFLAEEQQAKEKHKVKFKRVPFFQKKEKGFATKYYIFGLPVISIEKLELS